MPAQLRIEVVGAIIVARIRGQPTEALLRDCQQRVIELASEAGTRKVLYDALEIEPPSVDVVLSQQALDAELGPLKLRRSIVVPDTRLAYLARLAFGSGEHRVFYNDLDAAIRWLDEPA
jgi:hypothetical protein